VKLLVKMQDGIEEGAFLRTAGSVIHGVSVVAASRVVEK
jgi:hypothetical protein